MTVQLLRDGMSYEQNVGLKKFNTFSLMIKNGCTRIFINFGSLIQFDNKSL